MQSPPPVSMQNDTIKGIKFDKNISRQIETNDKKYNIKISNNDKIIYFEIDEINNFPKQDFNIHLNLEELCKINKFFLQFDNLNEVSESLNKLLDSKSIKAEKKEK